MSPEHAKAVLLIMMTADSDCSHCARKLVTKFIGKFPEHEQLAVDVFEKYHEETFSKDDE